MSSDSTMVQHLPGSHSSRAVNEYDQAEVLDPRWVVRLLRLGFALAALISQIAYVADAYTAGHFDLGFAHISSPYALFTLAASILAIAISFTPLFERVWKAVTLDFCLWLIAGWTYITVLNNQQAQLFVVILVLLTATCALVPWGTGWQAALTAGCIALAALNTLLVRPTSPFIVNLWLELLTASAITLAGTRLWGKWRTALLETHRRLRAEIAEREAAQNKLQESEGKLRKIFDSCPDIICISSMVDGRYIDVNPQFSMTGYTAHEAVSGCSEPLRLWAADPGQYRRLLNELSTAGVVRNMEADLRLKDETTRPCLVSGVLIELNGEPCAVTFTSDITRLKQTERKLIAAGEAALAASRAKSEFLSSMSHEIRTPLNAILGLSDLLAETTLTQEQHRYVEIMTSNGNALLDLISGILDLAKVESGKLHLEETEFDLDELVETVAETLSVRAHGKGLELVTHVLADVPLRLVGDPLRLRQVLVNLIGNAIKFTEHGEVALRVERRTDAHANGNGAGRQIRFSVCDTGIGIPADMRDAIFRSFTQADSSITRRYGGSGLGLAIVRRLVDLMGGSIRVESEVGKGSTFSFTVAVKAAPESGVSLAAPLSLTGTRVLVVDHNATSRLSLREILGSRGAEVAEACNGKQALAEIERACEASRPYQVVLLDHGLADVDGLQIAQRVQKEGGGALPIMMLTSENLNAKLSRLRQMGLRDYLVKPAKRSDLVRAVAGVTGRTIERHGFSLQQSTQAHAVQPRSLRILLTEDSPDNRTLIRAYLKNLPYQLDEAENGEVAAEKFTRRRYDLVLMDMQMPVMDGYTATRQIRSWEREKNQVVTPIVALTASALGEDVRRTLEAGCTAHLSKPVKKSRLLDAIRDLTTSSPRESVDAAIGAGLEDAAPNGSSASAPCISPGAGIAALGPAS